MKSHESRILIKWLFVIKFVLCVNGDGRCGKTAMSQYGLKLDITPYDISKVFGVGECTFKCLKDPLCQSYNMKISTWECMLLDSSHLQEEKKLKQTDNDCVYMVNLAHPCYSRTTCKNGGTCSISPTNHNTFCQCNGTGFVGTNCDQRHTSCSSLHQASPELPSGYYQLNVSGILSSVYCDMETRGGGWSLVSSVSRSNNKHLRNSALCYNTTLCVPHQGRNPSKITAQKRTDKDIRALAAYNSLFRIDVIKTYGYTTFFKIPSGAKFFSSSCQGKSCPRIITSHVYPYSWESSPCAGVDKGYRIYGKCFYVFDSYDNNECGSRWRSSKSVQERVLYGYCGTNGIFNGRAGYMYVK